MASTNNYRINWEKTRELWKSMGNDKVFSYMWCRQLFDKYMRKNYLIYYKQEELYFKLINHI